MKEDDTKGKKQKKDICKLPRKNIRDAHTYLECMRSKAGLSIGKAKPKTVAK